MSFFENLRKCRICGCTDHDCTECVELTDEPCHWVDDDLCSACYDSHANERGIFTRPEYRQHFYVSKPDRANIMIEVAKTDDGRFVSGYSIQIDGIASIDIEPNVRRARRTSQQDAKDEAVTNIIDQLEKLLAKQRFQAPIRRVKNALKSARAYAPPRGTAKS